MNNKLISVIIPVYNVENYLEKCIKSVIAQTYSELEIILIDDGSTDKSPQICDQYQEKDARVKVIHQKNQGLSAARNAGMRIATGEFISFVDSDDYININMLESLYQCAMEQEADIVVCDYEKVDEKENIDYAALTHDRTTYIEITDDNRFDYMLGETRVEFSVVWNKLYRRSLFEGIYFPVGKTHEDEFVTYKVLHKASKVIYAKEKMYYYVQRQSSIMGKGVNVKSLQRLEAYGERMDLYYNAGMNQYYYKMLRLYRYFLNEYYCAGTNSADKKKSMLPYKKFYRKQVLKSVWKMEGTMSMKLGHLLFAYCYPLYKIMK